MPDWPQPGRAILARSQPVPRPVPRSPPVPGRQPDLAMAVKAQVTATRTTPRPGGPGAGSRATGIASLRPPVAGRHRGRHRAIVRCRARYRIPPGPGPRASAGTRCAHQRRTRATPGPGSEGIWPASPAAADARRSRPSSRARRQATATSMRRRAPGPGRRQAVQAARRATANVRRPGHRTRGGHAARRPSEPVRAAAGPATQDQLDRAIADAQAAQGKPAVAARRSPMPMCARSDGS
jgi:hypothetical protein